MFVCLQASEQRMRVSTPCSPRQPEQQTTASTPCSPLQPEPLCPLQMALAAEYHATSMVTPLEEVSSLEHTCVQHKQQCVDLC